MKGMPAKRPAKWDREVDVVVMGSGGAALMAAMTAAKDGKEVLVIEKTHQLGGTTAFSGGVPWIPLNRYQKEAGIVDDREAALTYIRRITNGKEPDPKLVEVFVDNAYKAIDFLHENSPLRFDVPPGYPEYYSNFEGSRGGRSLDPKPFELDSIGELGAIVRNNPAFPPLTLGEGGAVGGIDWALLGERMEKNIVTMGRALAGGMIKGCLDAGVEFMIETAGNQLVLDDHNKIIGLLAKKGEEDFYIRAENVFLGSGGFEWNQELVKTFLKGEITHPLSPYGNTGDGLIMAMEAGAALGNMSEAWWYPAMQDPTFEYEDRPLNQLGGGRFGPNSIIVNENAERFAHEGATYNDLPKAFANFDAKTVTYPNHKHNYMIFDQQLKDKKMIITMMPGEEAPPWVPMADTMEELAEKINLDPEKLKATVDRWNMMCENGKDEDFGRAETYFENLNGGGGNKEANLGKIEQGPFYALPIFYGALGTNGGPRINEHGQVISLRGEVIEGLYAAGNAAMGIFGPAYVSAGGTIGPALAFGYLAGKHIGSKQDSKQLN